MLCFSRSENLIASAGRRLPRGLIVCLAIALAGCTVEPPGQTGSNSSSSRTGVISTSAGAATASAGGNFDPGHVASVLGPAVGTVIVNTNTGTAEGSGFAVAHQGGATFMITNNHVVSNQRKVQVVMQDGRHFTTSVQGTDPLGDIAVLKINDSSLALATLADSTKLRVGQPVVAIGSPLQQQGTVTSGIISALHRSITAGGGSSEPSEQLPDVLQTDAAINPGNSGGSLADSEGRVIGVNTAASSGATNIGFAIPSLVAKRIAEALIAGTKPGHPYVGVSFLTEADALAEGKAFNGFGVYVNDVVQGCPAERAGIRGGDVIQRVDGVDLNNGQTLGGVLQLHQPGDKIQVTVRRGDSTKDLQVALSDRPASGSRC